MPREKRAQLRRGEEWDRIVVDTPPSRSALDFVDAPQRLGGCRDGRLIGLLGVPAKVGGRAYLKVLNAGFGMVTGVLTRVLGAQVLRDVQTFVSALDTMFGGFRERADYTYRLLRAPGTAFLVIAAPEPDALREASYFVERLAQEGMPLAGLILNRVHGSPAARLSAARSTAAAETLQASDNGPSEPGSAHPGPAAPGPAPHGPAAHRSAGHRAPGHGAPDRSSSDRGAHALTIAALRLHAERMQLTATERRVSEHFTTAHPHVPVAEVPDQPDDVHDLAGLRAVR